MAVWHLRSTVSGFIHKAIISKGFGLRVSSLSSFTIVLNDLNNLVVLGKPTARPSNSHVKLQRGAVYNKTRYESYAVDTRKAFSSFYSFCFALAKPEYVTMSLLLSNVWLT
jgi:DCN1-like protein 4/5